jgi:hypothetical protein
VKWQRDMLLEFSKTAVQGHDALDFDFAVLMMEVDPVRASRSAM